MAKTKIITPYSSVPYIPMNVPSGNERNGAQFFSNVKQLSVGFGARVFRVDRDGMWAGAETFAGAPWRVDWNGNMTATSITLSGYIPTGGALNDIGVGNITNTYIGNNSISTGKIQTNAITADKISVSSLSAITANIGSVTSGTITGALVRSSSSGTRVQLNASNNTFQTYVSGTLRMEMYDNLLQFYNSSGSAIGALWNSSSNNILLTAGQQSSGSLLLVGGVSGSLSLSLGGNLYMTCQSGQVDFSTYIDMNNYEITDVYNLGFRSRSVTSGSLGAGEMAYHDSGGVQQFRVKAGSFFGSIDLTGV